MALFHLFVWFKILCLLARYRKFVSVSLIIGRWMIYNFLHHCRKLNGGVKTAAVELEGSAKPGIKHHLNLIRVSFETVAVNVMLRN